MRSGESQVNAVLSRWNHASQTDAVREILPCCGSQVWAEALSVRRPFVGASELLAASDQVWNSLPQSEWLTAFRSHPRIGESSTRSAAAATSAAWSRQEQSRVADAQEETKTSLARANAAYEEKFGHIFIVCATGKSAAEILEILRRRMDNDGATELREAAEQQRQVTQLRLKKWLAQ